MATVWPTPTDINLSQPDPNRRVEIRNSALEVLFDTLKCHGATFADSFWRRIFDSVLLPIFDHVRAEVRRWAEGEGQPPPLSLIHHFRSFSIINARLP